MATTPARAGRRRATSSTRPLSVWSLRCGAAAVFCPFHCIRCPRRTTTNIRTSSPGSRIIKTATPSRWAARCWSGRPRGSSRASRASCLKEGSASAGSGRPRRGCPSTTTFIATARAAGPGSSRASARCAAVPGGSRSRGTFSISNATGAGCCRISPGTFVAERLCREEDEMTTTAESHLEPWPSLPLEAWADTYATLHLWIQVAGKVRLVQSPWLNHTWHSTLYVTAHGLTTSPIPHGLQTFQIDFDFLAHRLTVQSSDGGSGGFAREPQSVAAFYARLMAELARLGLPVDIYRLPNEVPDPIRFDQDETHRSYDPEYANRFWRILVQADRIFKEFRARFIGKCSPVHFFWGAPDLAVTRFSGRRAPEHPGGIPNLPDAVTREAYSHEVSSCGFWPGGAGAEGGPFFYSYAYPAPPGFADTRVAPEAGRFDPALGEFILDYEAVRTAEDPDAA